MKLAAKITILCILVAICSGAVCTTLAVRFEWQQAVRRQAEDWRETLQDWSGSLRSMLTDAQSPVTARAVALLGFERLAGHYAGAILMQGQDYLRNETGLALGDLLDDMEPLTSGSPVLQGAFRLNGQSFLLMAAPVYGRNFTLLAASSLEDVDAGTQALAWRCASASAAVIAAACLLSYAIARRTLAPLEQLRTAAERITAGCYDQRISMPGSDEVADLSRTFDHMAASVEQNVHALQERTETQNRFIGNLGHEIRTPMAAIQLHAETLCRRSLSESSRQVCAEHILAQARWLSQLSERLMDLVLLEKSASLFPLRTPEFCEDVEAAAADLAAIQGIVLDVQCIPGVLQADRTLLLSAVLNLVTNAVRASAPGQHIRIRISADSITVTDEGSGMNAEQLRLACEPFYTGETSRSKRTGGSGLGLALVESIAHAHGGRLQIESRPGLGTTARIIFPVTDNKRITEP